MIGVPDVEKQRSGAVTASGVKLRWGTTMSNATAAERFDGLEQCENKGVIRLTRCPACGLNFLDGEQPASHFRLEHTPADFGLSPLEETDG